MDRDPRLVWSWTADGFPAPLLRLLQVVGVEPVICPPRCPDKKPYVERCVRTFKHEGCTAFSFGNDGRLLCGTRRVARYHNT